MTASWKSAATRASAGLLIAALWQPAAAEAQSSEPLVAVEAALAADNPDRALALLAPILKKSGKNAQALLLRSTANCQIGEIDDCRKDLDRALALDPTLRQGWLNRSALAIADKRYDEALVALVEAERLAPQSPDNSLNQGAVLLLQGKLEESSARFEKYLAVNPGSADAYYLVATNFALAGYSALAAQHLNRAIEIDERSRVRARSDANFAEIASSRALAGVFSTDSFRIAPGSSTAVRTYASPWRSGSSPLLTAVLNALQIAATPMDPRVEVTDDWALLWADLRIKIARRGDTETALELSAPPGQFSPERWERRTRELFEAVEIELLRLDKRPAGAP